MKVIGTLLLGLTLLSTPLRAQGAELNCTGGTNVEEFRYSWRLRGGFSWVAGLVFPRSGYGNLKTTYPEKGEHQISSELMITPADGKSGFYMYESQMDELGQKTLMTYHGYAWGNKARKERTIFDYVKRLMRIHRETPEKIEDRVKLIPTESLRESAVRDVLTAIYFLRQNADQIHGPIQTTIFSDGKAYPVVFRPAGRGVFTIQGTKVNARGFEIVDAPGGRKWQGGVKVYLSDDSRRIPFRLEIQQSVASLQLDLQSVESCAFMRADQ